MSNLLIKSIKFKIREVRQAAQVRNKSVRAEDKCVLGATHYLGNSIEVRTRKLPFISAAEITVTDNKRGVRTTRTLAFPPQYINVEYAYSGDVFKEDIATMIEYLKSI